MSSAVSILQKSLFEYKYNLPADQVEKLETYIKELLKWNKAYNLTGFKTEQEMVNKNVIDSLSVSEFLIGNSVLDVGTGAGFPGLPLAIVNPKKTFTLLDSSQKRIAFLRNLITLLGINNVNLVCSRVEDFTGSFTSITSRAFASLEKMLVLTGHLCDENGCFLAMKGKLDKEEITNIPKGFVVDKTLFLDSLVKLGERHLVVVRKTINKE